MGPQRHAGGLRRSSTGDPERPDHPGGRHLAGGDLPPHGEARGGGVPRASRAPLPPPAARAGQRFRGGRSGRRGDRCPARGEDRPGGGPRGRRIDPLADPAPPRASRVGGVLPRLRPRGSPRNPIRHQERGLAAGGDRDRPGLDRGRRGAGDRVLSGARRSSGARVGAGDAAAPPHHVRGARLVAAGGPDRARHGSRVLPQGALTAGDGDRTGRRPSPGR